jgi:DNA topoisomerase-1
MVKVEAFKSLEASLAIRLGKRLKQLTHEDYRRVANAIEDGKWGLAEYTLNRITLNNFFKGQTEYVAYLTRMAMLFGASLVTSKPANTVVGLGYEDAIQVQMIHNFESLVLLKLTDTLKVFGLQLIANYKEAAIQKTESDAIQNLDSEYQVQKSNPYHDAGGRFTDKSHWVTGGATNENFSEEDKARLKSLKIPPAWVNVKLNPDTTAPLQAIGQDTKGRTQYIYSATHSEAAAAEKFARLEEFNRELPSIRAKLDKDILSTDIPKQQAAAVLYLIDKTGFRVGSTTDTKAKQQAYGASTLQGQHVKVSGNKVVFTFVGKKGVAITKVVKDKGLAKLITDANPQDNKPLFNASDVNVRDYLSSIAGKGFKVKDFRTWHGTFLALKEVASRPIPTTATAYKKMRNEVATVVADFLGNTPIVALSAYINPEVFKGWDNFVFKAESESDIEYMNRFFDTHRYDETKDWRKTPATEFDPDDNEEDDKILEKVQKFNPHHDEKGRFSSKDRAVTVSNDMLLYEGKYVAGLEKRHSNYDWKIISKAASEAHANILEQHPELSVIPVHLGDRIPKGHNTNGGCYAGTETGALPYVVLSAFHDDKLLECFDSENNLQMKGLPA